MNCRFSALLSTIALRRGVKYFKTCLRNLKKKKEKEGIKDPPNSSSRHDIIMKCFSQMSSS